MFKRLKLSKNAKKKENNRKINNNSPIVLNEEYLKVFNQVQKIKKKKKSITKK